MVIDQGTEATRWVRPQSRHAMSKWQVASGEWPVDSGLLWSPPNQTLICQATGRAVRVPCPARWQIILLTIKSTLRDQGLEFGGGDGDGEQLERRLHMSLVTFRRWCILANILLNGFKVGQSPRLRSAIGHAHANIIRHARKAKNENSTRQTPFSFNFTRRQGLPAAATTTGKTTTTAPNGEKYHTIENREERS